MQRLGRTQQLNIFCCQQHAQVQGQLPCLLETSHYVVEYLGDSWSLPCLNAFPEFELVTCALPLPHPHGFPSTPSADWVPGGLNIWGKTELDFLEYPNQPFLKPVGESRYDIWTHMNLQILKFINLKCSWEWCIIPMCDSWWNMMALSRVPGGSVSQIQLAFLQAMSWDTSTFTVQAVCLSSCHDTHHLQWGPEGSL